MAKMGNVDFSELKKLQENLNKMVGSEDARSKFCEDCAKELAARLLRSVIKRTPVGVYPASSGKVGGTLRRGWTSGKDNAQQALNNLHVTKSSGVYTIEITNPVEYASYVEYGHRTSNHKRWVPGKFMMTISENEIKKIAPQLLEKKLATFFGGAFDAK